MASCKTRQWVSTAPYFQLTVTQSSSTNTTVTLSYTVQYVAQYAASTSGAGNRTVSVTIDGSSIGPFTYAINGVTGTKTVASGTKTVNKGTAVRYVSFSISVPMNLTWSGTYGGTMSGSSSISIPPKTSYTISYNANGGSGAPSNQTKWAGTNITLSSTKPSRTGYSFSNWLSSAQNTTFSPGATYSYDASTTMKAQWTANKYTVSYNANGGSGAPSSQTKTYGVDLTLSSTKPTRTNYTFKGWGTSASSTTASFQPGDKYTINTSKTLYAIWQSSYVAPRITNMTVDRCNSSGTITDEGTYALVKFTWATDKTVSSVKIEYKTESATSYGSATTISASGTSGTVSKVIGGSFNVETTYNVRATVSDSSGDGYSVRDVSPIAYIVDFKAGGKGVAFGKPADTDDLFEVEYPAQFNDSITLKGNKVITKRCHVGQSGSSTTNPWYKFASTYNVTSYSESYISFKVTYAGVYSAAKYGIINAGFRTDKDGTGASRTSLVIESDTGLDPTDFVMAYGDGYYELWVRIQEGYSYARFEVLSETKRQSSYNDAWTLYNQSSTGFAEQPTSDYTTLTATRASALNAYPVGAIYMAYNHTSPASLFGGTWTRITTRFLWGTTATGTIGATGGAQTHTLSVSEIPSHQHYLWNYSTSGGSSSYTSYSVQSYGNTGYGANVKTSYVGGGSAHNNMPPYISVSIWRRTA